MECLFHFLLFIWRDQTFIVCIQFAFTYFVLHVLFYLGVFFIKLLLLFQIYYLLTVGMNYAVSPEPLDH